VPAARVIPAPSTAEEALSAICADLSLRDLNLVDSLLAQLEDMESREDDADRLAELYRLDHLAARLRRNAENLRVLAGRDAGDGSSGTSTMVDVIRAAMSSIDHYERVTIGRVVGLGVVGFAAEDVSRLLAELLDNATKSSPPHAPVRVGVHLTEQGSALLRVEDEGIGLPAERTRQLNQRLTEDPVLDDAAVRHMGLAVVRRLAVRHQMRIWLDGRYPHGTTASVLIPAALICELPEASWSGLRTVTARPAGAAAGDDAVRARPSRDTAVGRERRVPRRDAASRGGGPAGLSASRAPGSPSPLSSASSASSTLSALPSRSPSSVSSSLPSAPAQRRAPGSGAARDGTAIVGTDPTGPGDLADPTDPGAGTGGTAAGAAAAASAGTTASGLPRRVSRSLRGVSGANGRAFTAPPDIGAGADHEKLLADLGAFSEGERAAREEQRGA
jgi:two-component sensor histidine kinase